MVINMKDDEIERVLGILKDVVFPIRNMLQQATGASACEFLVSLHEHNGYCVNGFSISEDVLKITDLENENLSATVKVLKHYLANIDFIRLRANGSLLNKIVEYSCDFIFSHKYYTISCLHKQFKYEECPSQEEKILIVSDFKNYFQLDI